MAAAAEAVGEERAGSRGREAGFEREDGSRWRCCRRDHRLSAFLTIQLLVIMSQPAAEVNLHDPANMSDLEWTNLLKEIDSSLAKPSESPIQKLKRKLAAEPLIPIGCLATVACLAYGLTTMATGNRRQSQLAMRGRVIAQAFTIFIVSSGMYYGLTDGNKKHLDKK